MIVTDNKNIVRRLLEEAFNKSNQAVVDELVASSFIDHNPLPGLPPNREGFRQSFVIFRHTFPDMVYIIEDIVAAEDKVVVRWSANGTQKEELMEIPPTGKRISVIGIDIFRITKGQISELWLTWDQLGMLQQLGVMPQN